MTEDTEQKKEDQLKKIAELKSLLEKRLKDLQIEFDGLNSMLDFVNSILVERGFKRAQIGKPVAAPVEEKLVATAEHVDAGITTPSSVLEEERAVPIKMPTGELLANLYVSEESIRVVLAEDKQFTVDTPPFMPFLVDRVLAKMREKDREAADRREIEPEKILSYQVVQDGDILKEIVIHNMGPDRSRELKSTIRWTLEKMYEKIKASV